MKQRATTKSASQPRAHHGMLWSILFILAVLIGAGALPANLGQFSLTHRDFQRYGLAAER